MAELVFLFGIVVVCLVVAGVFLKKFGIIFLVFGIAALVAFGDVCHNYPSSLPSEIGDGIYEVRIVDYILWQQNGKG